MEVVVPAVVILVGNLFSGNPGSGRWEYITALFGWVGAVSWALWIVSLVVGPFLMPTESGRGVAEFLYLVGAFCVLQALSRDYERWFKPLVDRYMKIRNRSD